MEVEFSPSFHKFINRQNDKDYDKIYDFIDYVRDNGLTGLPGRNKHSNNADTRKKGFIDKATYANKYNLWHYHIGIPYYNTKNGKGDYTSSFILHYQILDKNVIKIIKMDNHKPFVMPTEAELRERLHKLAREAKWLFSKKTTSL